MSYDQEPTRISITDVFDLHSVTPQDVELVQSRNIFTKPTGWDLRRFGSSTAVELASSVKPFAAFLARTPFVASYGDAPEDAGGWGATFVTLM